MLDKVVKTTLMSSRVILLDGSLKSMALSAERMIEIFLIKNLCNNWNTHTKYCREMRYPF